MIINSETAGDLIKQLEQANQEEANAIRAMAKLAEAGQIREAIAAGLMDEVTRTHDRKMGIIDQLQAHRLDK